MLSSFLDSIVKAISALLIAISAFLAAGLERLQGERPPCVEPLAYTIGTFDRQFNLSQRDFLAALSEAEAVWESSSQRNLFAYSSENGDLKINLIYDYRQQVTEELTEIKGEVSQDEAAYRALESKYNKLKAEHAELKRAYDAKVEAFNSRNLAYEQDIQRWNRSNRTNENEFERLEAEKLSLQVEIAGLKSLEADLNSKVREINMLVGQLNALARDLNLNVEEFNTIGASRGDTFAGGVYTSDASGERIDIFEFSNHDKLVRVLAHELGHALGLDHVEDPKAIMYKLNESEAAEVSETDIAALNALCAN